MLNGLEQDRLNPESARTAPNLARNSPYWVGWL